MRKVLTIGLLTLTVVTVAIFLGGWFIQAKQLRKSAELMIAQLNEQQTYFTYDSMDVSGFPTRLSLNFVNPRFSGRIDQILKNAPQPAPNLPASNIPEWHEDIAFNGVMTFSVNAFSTHYTFTTSGNWTKSSTLAGKEMGKISSKMSGVNQCSLTLARSSLFSNFWNYRITNENATELLKEIREFDCNIPAYQLINEGSNVPLINSGATRFYFSSNPHGSGQQIRIFAKSNDAEVTAEGEKYITSYIAALSPDYPFPPLFSIYGKQNMDIDFTYTGPLNAASQSNPNIDINLSNFNLSNDIYTSKGYFRLINNVTGDSRTSSINTRFESVYTELYDMVLKDTVRNFIRHTITSNDPELQQLRNILQSRTPEESFTLIEPAIPQLHLLGTQVIALNGSYQGASNFMSGDYNMSEIAVTMTPYGITGSGTAKTSPQSLFPTARTNLVCTNCMQLLDDLLSYTGRVIGVIQAFSAEPPPFNVSPSLIDGTKKFFHALSNSTPEEKNKGHFLYTIISEPNGNLSIGGRSLQDVIALYNTHIGQVVVAPEGSIPPQGWKVE